MAKNHRQTYKSAKKTEKKVAAPQKEKTPRKPILLPIPVLFFVLIWAWAAFYYGDVFRIAREYSFWAPDSTLMYYEEGRPWGMLWQIGLALLQLYRWPILGGAATALLLSGSTWMLGYCLRLRGWWRVLQYIPAAAYLIGIAYEGFDIYFEAETGMIMGIPFLCFLVLLILTIIIRSFSSHPYPTILRIPLGDKPLQNRLQALITVLILCCTIGVTHWMRPYVRVVTRMQVQMMEQDWLGMTETARADADLSYRQIAAYYAIALVQRGEIASRLFDIRLDYDDPYMHGFNGEINNASNYYLMDCDFQAGLVETAIHHAMEQMTMNGPNIRAIKLLTKCALMRGEWEVAEKYFKILEKVPFEGDWIAKYKPMLHNEEAVNNDSEIKNTRLIEPLHDMLENQLVQPVFLGYNASLLEGRSINALWNSLMVHIYTKTMEPFVFRCQPLRGTTPPQSIAEALTLLSNKHPELTQMYQGLDYNKDRLVAFLQETAPYIKANGTLTSSENRALHARELFPQYKGYYPYYYFFGNLKATKKTKENSGTSNQGVN